ncbi:MAG: DUF2490 domain-containing protein [Nitritalea sp.]
MKKYILRLLCFVLLFFAGERAVYSQVPETGNWLIYFGNQNFGNNKWVFHNEIQYRNYNFVGNTEQLLIRTGIGRYLTENNNILSAGYAFIHTRPLGELDGILDVVEDRAFDEHRLWQQFWSRQNVGRLVLIHRYRFEQRFFGDDDFRMRWRYFLGANFPLNKNRMGEDTWYLSAYNEIFLNSNQEDNPAIFDRNRLYGAIGYQTSPRLRFEVGFMRQSTNNPLFTRNQLQFVIFNNLPFGQR